MTDELQERLYREGLAVAPFSKRVWSYAIDELVISLLVAFAFYDALSSSADMASTLNMINSSVVPIILLKVAYHTFFLWAYGASLGKLALKIRVVNSDDFEKPEIGVALVRSMVRIASESAFWIGFIWAYFSPITQTWHDKMAKTVVVSA